jgi:rhodanese-related sulfurtransferase
MVRNWTRQQVMEGLDGDTIVVVDVREPHEFAMGHIPGSVSLPLSRFDPSQLPREPGKTIVLSCAAGVRSLKAMQIARDFGVMVDSHYQGGFQDWLQAGAPIARG